MGRCTFEVQAEQDDEGYRPEVACAGPEEAVVEADGKAEYCVEGVAFYFCVGVLVAKLWREEQVDEDGDEHYWDHFGQEGRVNFLEGKRPDSCTDRGKEYAGEGVFEVSEVLADVVCGCGEAAERGLELVGAKSLRDG